MKGGNKRPPFRTAEEQFLFHVTPKWQVWEAAFHLAAAATGEYDAAFENGSALQNLKEEIELHKGAGK